MGTTRQVDSTRKCQRSHPGRLCVNIKSTVPKVGLRAGSEIKSVRSDGDDGGVKAGQAQIA